MDGESYYFISREEFMDMADNGELLEWAEYSGNCYGTPKASVDAHIRAGDQVILEIDVQGAFQVREVMPDAVLVFIDTPSRKELERRLRARGTEDEETIVKRLSAADMELSRKMEYDIQLVNDDVAEATAQLVAVVNRYADTIRG